MVQGKASGGWDRAIGTSIQVYAQTLLLPGVLRYCRALISRRGSTVSLAVLLLFIGSGCAALIYEIVWFQLLQLVIGSAALSLAVILGTFMGGMCLGSLLLPRMVSPKRHPLRVFGLLELGIGAGGLLVLWGMPGVNELYGSVGTTGTAGTFWRVVICAMCLFPPTFMMGATLPAISRWVERTPRGASRLGMFYTGNLTGAVAGCVIAGFHLLRVHDMVAATMFAAAINGIVAILALFLSLAAQSAVTVSASEPGARPARGLRGALPVYLAIGLSGLGALGAEVVWTRQLSLIFGQTVYTFSIILAVFLAGLGIGSGFGAALARTLSRPLPCLAVCQMLLIPAITWAAWSIATSLPDWVIAMEDAADPWKVFRFDALRCAWATLPAAILWGASFPLGLASVIARGNDPGRNVGRLYAINTAGAICAVIGFSIVLIPWLGSQNAQRALIAVSATAGLVLVSGCFFTAGTGQALTIAPLLTPSLSPSIEPAPMQTGRGEDVRTTSVVYSARNMSRPCGFLAVVTVVVAGSVVAAWSVPEVPGLLVAYGREYPEMSKNPPKILYVGEGRIASVAVTEWQDGARNFHVAGKVEASSAPHDMRLQRMLGHLSALMHPRPRSILIVGFGSGMTAGTFLLHPDVERIVICEIEPLIPEVVSGYFSKLNYDVVGHRKVEILTDDARHFITTTAETFDVITSDPIHPWVKGSATLYSTEYFERVKARLNPGGVISQWVPLYDSTPETVQSAFATFFDAFPLGMVWSNDLHGSGYDVVLIARDGPMTVNIEALAHRIQSPDHQAVAQSLKEAGFNPAYSLFLNYAGWAPDLEPWFRDAPINTDLNLRLQYMAGMTRENDPDGIYRSFLVHRTYPQEVFTGGIPDGDL